MDSQKAKERLLISGATGIGAASLGSLALQGLSESFYTAAERSKRNIKATAKLLKHLKEKGVNVELDSLANKIGPFFNPADASIHIGSKKIPTGVLAHEWGHALNADLVKSKLGGIGAKAHDLTYRLGRLAGVPAAATALAAHIADADTDTVRNIGLVGAGLQAPMLAEEILASARGAKQLHHLKLPGKLGAFAGLPSYAMLTAAPLAPWLLRKAEPSINELLKNGD
jgi:hypothetical protein